MKIKKEAFINYLFIAMLIVVVIGAGYFINNKLTGYAVLPEYTAEVDCVDANYTWYNEACYDDPPSCGNDFLELCLDETNCVSEGGYWYSDVCNAAAEPVCDSSHLTLCDETNCTGAGGFWYNDVCNAAAEPSCSNDLSLCLDATNCTDVGQGHWYNETCNAEAEPSCSNDLSLCLDVTNCTDVGQGYWYNDVCNVNECASNENCASGYECNENNVCTEVAVSEEEITSEEDVKIDVYRLENNQCNSITIWENDKTSNDYTTLEKCEENIEEEIILDVVKLSVGVIQPLSINPNETKKANWVVKNIWTNTLHDCKFNSIGDFPSWINNYNETETLDAGEEYKFVFDVTIPEETEIGQYNLGLSLDCPGASKSTNFIAEVKEKKLGFELIKVERRKEEVRIYYSIEELAGVEQNITLDFILFNGTEQKAEAKDNYTIEANSTDKFKTSVPINTSLNQSLEGELNLLINLNSEIYSDSIEEVIVLGAPITGFAVLGGGTATYLVSIILIVLVLVAAYFITKKNYKKFIKQ